MSKSRGSGAQAPAEKSPDGAHPKRPRIFVGDVQGCAAELESLLEALHFDPAAHDLWFTGDLVNRGPDSLGVLRRARALGARTVLGNHDLHLLGIADRARRPRPDDTLDGVLRAPDRGELLGWLRAQPLVQAWDDLLLVHAGVHPQWEDPVAVARPLEAKIRAGLTPWDDDALSFLTRVRHCDRKGRRPREDRDPPPEFEPWDHFYRGARTVVCGHWAQRGLVRSKRIRGIDTGCVWGGSLTAWLAEEDRIVSVPAARPYREPR